VRVRAGPWRRRDVALRADVSSQFATALLLAAPRAGGLRLELVGPVVSDGYLELTAAALEAFRVPLTRDAGRWVVEGGAPVAAPLAVEADASSAAAWWAAAARTGGRVVVEGVPCATKQPDAALLGLLERMGARVAATPEGEVEVTGPGGPLRALGEVDLRGCPDLAPLVAALAADAEGETLVVGAPHLRWKESDRVASVVAAVRAVGGEAEPREDGFLVRGRPLSGGRVLVEGDHRIALAFGALGLWVEGVVLEGAQAVAKSYPHFLDALTGAAEGASSG
jgi:3-phosphoshikimate 1-carboxyvinyltransferase